MGLILFSLVLIFEPFPTYAELWTVQIPGGSSDPGSGYHFNPQEITVNVGDRVEWSNGDTVIHTVVSGSLETGHDEKFHSGEIKSGQKFSKIFTEIEMGEITYFCSIHPWITGIINVAKMDPGFQTIHNVGSDVSETTFDVQYKVQRNLSSAKVEPQRNTITFSFVGKIENDNFIVKLPIGLIKNPNSVWINDNQITKFETTSFDDHTVMSIPLIGETQQVKIMGTEVVGKFKPKPFYLINQIFAVTDHKTYRVGENITISGEVKNQNQLFLINLGIISPSGVTIFWEDISLKETAKFSSTINSKKVLREPGTYQIKLTGQDSKTLILSFDYTLKESVFPSPKKQAQMDVPNFQIRCNEDRVLMKRVFDGSAVCLTESTANILLKREWVTSF